MLSHSHYIQYISRQARPHLGHMAKHLTFCWGRTNTVSQGESEKSQVSPRGFRLETETSVLCELSRSLLFATPRTLRTARLCSPWDFPGKNTEIGCHFLLQGIFLTQEPNLPLLHWQADSLPLRHLGSHLETGSESKNIVGTLHKFRLPRWTRRRAGIS